MKLQVFTLVAMAAMSMSCKKQEASENKALDQFLDSDAQAYTCSGSYNDGSLQKGYVSITARNVSHGQAARKALTSIPDDVKDHFTAIGGRIEVISNTNEVCGEGQSIDDLAFAGQGQAEIDACWAPSRVTDAGGEDKGGLVIYVKDDETLISQGLVRVFGYVFSQTIQKTFQSVEGSDEKEQVDDRGYRVLANELLMHLTAMDGINEAVLNQAVQSPNRFGDSVFAESFDSYYCSVESKKTMETKFEALYDTFRIKGAKVIESYATLEGMDEGTMEDYQPQVQESGEPEIQGSSVSFLQASLSIRHILQQQELLKILDNEDFRANDNDDKKSGKCRGFFAKIKAFFAKFKKKKGKNVSEAIFSKLETNGRCGIFCKKNNNQEMTVDASNAGMTPDCKQPSANKVSIENGVICRVR